MTTTSSSSTSTHSTPREVDRLEIELSWEISLPLRRGDDVVESHDHGVVDDGGDDEDGAAGDDADAAFREDDAHSWKHVGGGYARRPREPRPRTMPSRRMSTQEHADETDADAAADVVADDDEDGREKEDGRSESFH